MQKFGSKSPSVLHRLNDISEKKVYAIGKSLYCNGELHSCYEVLGLHLFRINAKLVYTNFVYGTSDVIRIT